MWTGKQKIKYAEYILDAYDEGYKLDWWQRWYFEQEHKFLIATKGRRVGWSFITAMKGLIECLDPNSKRYTKQFVSFSLEDAKEKIAYAREFYYSLPRGIKKKKIITDSKTILEFEDVGGRSRSRLISLPCKQVRGKGGTVSLDEFAFHAKAGQIYISALPVISRGGLIEIGSTPFGNKGKFFEIVNDKSQYKKFIRIDLPWWYSPALCTNVRAAIEEADNLIIEQRVEKYGTEIVKDIFDSMPLEDFQQEYECSFRDEIASYITLDMIESCTPLGDNELIPFKTLDEFIVGYDPAKHGTLYAGYDVGRVNDAAELVVFGIHPEYKIRAVLASISYRKTDFDTQIDNLTKLMNKLPVHRLCIDATGLGMQLAETMEKKSEDLWKESLLPILLKMFWLQQFIWLFSELSIYCLLTESCGDKFIRLKKSLLFPVMLDTTLIAIRNTSIMRISSGLWLLLNMPIRVVNQARGDFISNSRKSRKPQVKKYRALINGR